MTRAAAATIVSAIFLLVAWSCGDDGSGDGADPTLDELPELLVEALCPELESCLGDEATRIYFGAGGCEERFLMGLEDGDFQATQDAVEAGRVRYDASKVSACLASFNGIGCGFQTRRAFTSEACGAVLEGDVEVGGDCALDEECKGPAFCRRDGATCPGTCTALLEAGEDCEEDDDCAEGLTCSQLRCVAPGRLGEACGRSTDPTCAAGLVCIGAGRSSDAGECGEAEELYAAQLGETCDPESFVFCDDDLACAVVTPIQGAAQFKCMERVELGDACTFGLPSQCPSGTFCANTDVAEGDVEGTCAELPDDNDQCNRGVGQECADGLVCGPDDICREVGRLGDGCAYDGACASQHCDDGVCARPATCALTPQD